MKLKKKAEESLSVSVTDGVEKTTKIEKEGTHPDLLNKVCIDKFPKVGLSKGATINIGNYESLRVDAWLTDEVQEGETLEEAFSRIESILDEVLEPYFEEEK